MSYSGCTLQVLICKIFHSFLFSNSSMISFLTYELLKVCFLFKFLNELRVFRSSCVTNSIALGLEKVTYIKDTLQNLLKIILWSNT